jgi:hypothetical protein
MSDKNEFLIAQELEEERQLRERLNEILDANALHGGRKENGLWSFHDLPELAAKAMAHIDKLEDQVGRLLSE